jgi:hypothetical protein
MQGLQDTPCRTSVRKTDDTTQVFELFRKGQKRKRIFLGFPNPERMPFQENRKNSREQGGYDMIYIELGFRK